MTSENLTQLRNRIDEINDQLLDLLNERTALVEAIGREKDKQGLKKYDPIREQQIIEKLREKNQGPLTDEMLIHVFKEIFKVSVKLQEEKSHKKGLLVSRKNKLEDTVIDVQGDMIGDGEPTFVFGPCSVESKEQMERVAKNLSEKGLKYIRGGAFKPRTSPYDFQGLGIEGLKMMSEAAKKYGLRVVSEIMDAGDLEAALPYVDVIQIGARNMQNFSLLKALGHINKPVLLKRGLSATIEEFVNAAEYIAMHGNPNVMLCERGIRTYEKATRNTLDISAVPILKRETHLPVFVDITHSTGRKDILLPIAKAALAVGADGIMAEVHPNPMLALSDANQQMSLEEFDLFYKKLRN
ncbi:MAG: bifunctional 3-deoxy-7-phosphoheptulonate synthase/chorismate mutase [Turicibacter sp.]|uniref:Bifunctional 3-deoxy-7-phosphoheptulonate synthase/chorismate mutase n=1 Tax=Turicibacter faecis TaxID=2963365 RepID=A0ABM8IH09_9FIRM|nr:MULTISPECIES: bifunctional 3-deoxy-7-phosphoheptulonate synthase/chorismate mutase [unclassified Turicibacter]MCI9350336.1 bifunctional 3-deoxy-7-phosphoheptulonate synthase/chorismate mutase [Turicibacter sp.]MCU7210106.1 bifunctional 3-deoxy-7-phosphoheptulonate synthase/chorismate mutase [Turicibacter sp. 1E2]NCE78506.1 3-deoxy-7-phosphoheptulonate synthase [Turicibacter sp. TS3]BEH90539.1 bifunctional 3-deoxy-7-phosphoheptulonate synthase/chorismate mutase [Turicibacter sp. TC023]